MIDSNKIDEEAHYYARKIAGYLAHTKGFPFSEDQIYGILEIYKAYNTAAVIIAKTEGIFQDPNVIIEFVISDFVEFIDTDIRPNTSIFKNVIFEYCKNKIISTYILRRGITDCSDIMEAEEKITKLIEDDKWDDLKFLLESEEKCQEM